MDNKKFFFLAGLPRSGNILLSSILNQNPDIIVTPYSFLVDVFYLLDDKFRYSEPSRMSPDYINLIDNFLEQLLPTFYGPLKCKYVIDRCPDWGTTYNLKMLKRFVGKDVKIISPVRNILEILASFIVKIKENEETNYIDKELKANTVPVYRTLDDARCDELMKPGGHIDSALHTLSQSKLLENKNNFHLVEYDNLVRNTKKEIKKIYDFLEIDYYDDHVYNNIQQFNFLNNPYIDDILGMNLHEIRTTIKKTSVPYRKILSKHTINKYKDCETWK